MKVATITVGPIAANCYILYEDKAVIIDPGAEPQNILAELNKLSIPLEYIIYTHAHWDHMGAAFELKEQTGAKVIMSVNDTETYKSFNLSAWLGFEGKPAEPDIFVKDGEYITAGAIKLKVIETPGHSPGGISLYTDGFLFSGDTIFYNSIGRTDLPGGDIKVLEDSIRNKIYTLDDDVEIYPGHGPATSVGWEKENNPFCPMA